MTAPDPRTASPLRAEFSLALAVRRHLASVSAVRAVLGPPGPSVPGPEQVWLFTDALAMAVEGTGSAAMVLRSDGAWSRPNEHNTAQFPRLVVEVTADFTRGSRRVPDAEARARRAIAPVTALLHRPSGFAEVWGRTRRVDGTVDDPGVRVHGAQAVDEPSVDPITDFDGGRRLTAYFGLNVG